MCISYSTSYAPGIKTAALVSEKLPKLPGRIGSNLNFVRFFAEIFSLSNLLSHIPLFCLTFLYSHKNLEFVDKRYGRLSDVTLNSNKLTTTLITNKCIKRVLSSIVTHSYMFRPCWVIFRENFFVIVTLRLHFIVE
jgi:hypothetical protein